MNLPQWDLNDRELQEVSDLAAKEMVDASVAWALRELHERVANESRHYGSMPQPDRNEILRINTMALAELRRQTILFAGLEDAAAFEELNCFKAAISAAEAALNEIASGVVLQALKATRADRCLPPVEEPERKARKENALAKARRWISGRLHDIAYAIQPN